MLKDNNINSTGQFIDEILKMDPGYELSENFAEKLAQKFERRFAWNQYIKEFLIYFGVGFGILSTAVGMVFFLMSEIWAKWIDIFFANSEAIIGTAFLLTFVLFIDKVLLRYFSYTLNSKKLNT